MTTTVPCLMSPTALAKEVGIDRKTLVQFIETGRVTVYRAGPRTFRIDLHEFLAAMRAYGSEEDTAD